MFKSLRIRLRVLLIFAGLTIGALLSITAALWYNYHRLTTAHNNETSFTSEDVFSAFLNTGLMAGFAMLGLTVFIWLLFDENVAKAVEHLAANLRSRAHTDLTDEMDPELARYLGDLGPAASALTKRLSEEKVKTAEAIARETARLEEEKAQLTKLFSDIPIGVIMVGNNEQITLYDGQAAAAFENYHPLGLGQPITDYFCETTLNQTCEGLKLEPPGASVDIRLPTADKTLDYKASLRLLGEGLGYIIALSAEHKGLASRPLTFDFSINEQLTSAKLGDKKLRDLCCIVFDTETTGLSTNSDDVIQIGAVRIVKGRRIEGEIFDSYVNPNRPIPPASTKVHGIRDDMVKGAPDFIAAAEKFYRFSKNAILIAHNAPFDLAFFKRDGETEERKFNHPVLDTVLLSASVFGQSMSHTLDALASRLGIEIEEEVRHTALGDAIATAEVFLKLLPLLEAKNIITLRDAQEAMRKEQRLLMVVNDEDEL